MSGGYIFVSRCNRLFGRTAQHRVGFLSQPGKLFIRHALVIFIRPDLLGISLAHPGNGMLGVIAIHHRHIVTFEVVEVTRRQHGKGGFADPALLGGKGDIKGCFLVFHIAFFHYWLIDLFIAFNHSVFHSFFQYCRLEILKECFISILFSCFHSFLKD